MGIFSPLTMSVLRQARDPLLWVLWVRDSPNTMPQAMKDAWIEKSKTHFTHISPKPLVLSMNSDPHLET